MLSLARRAGQKIRIGSDIVIVIREIRGRQVKIGVEAPSHIRVLREEIFEELSAANRTAAAPSEVPEALAGLRKKNP
ncbi:MAG: carbon storage regulator [Myxococcota bacterium]